MSDCAKLAGSYRNYYLARDAYKLLIFQFRNTCPIEMNLCNINLLLDHILLENKPLNCIELYHRG